MTDCILHTVNSFIHHGESVHIVVNDRESDRASADERGGKTFERFRPCARGSVCNRESIGVFGMVWFVWWRLLCLVLCTVKREGDIEMD